MSKSFEIKCKKCNNNIAVEVRATTAAFGDSAKVKLVCLVCEHQEEIPVVQNNYYKFQDKLTL